MTDNTNANAKTDIDFIRELEGLFIQLDSVNESIKTVKGEAKEAGFDSALLAAVAKALANSKEDDLLEKSEALVELINKVN